MTLTIQRTYIPQTNFTLKKKDNTAYTHATDGSDVDNTADIHAAEELDVDKKVDMHAADELEVDKTADKHAADEFDVENTAVKRAADGLDVDCTADKRVTDGLDMYSVRVPPLFILTDTSFDAFHWLLKKTIFFTVVQCSQGVLCILQERP